MKYKGEYKNGKKNGYGILEFSDGKKYKGYWENGKKTGVGEIYFPDKNIWKNVMWKKG